MRTDNFKGIKARLNGISRRDFMKYCSIMASSLGLSTGVAPKIAEALADPARRPSTIWLHGQECTGCTETLLRLGRHPLGRPKSHRRYRRTGTTQGQDRGFYPRLSAQPLQFPLHRGPL